MLGTWLASNGARPFGDNPLTLIRMPKNPPPRERRLRTGEIDFIYVRMVAEEGLEPPTRGL